jgi:ABC-2 type transport system ATP-binding protein
MLVESIIKASNLVKKFGTFTAVDQVSFSIASGEIVAFLGPNGAGKSTTIKLLTTLSKPTSGFVYLLDNDVVLHPALCRKTFGIVFQDPSLDDELTAFENLEFHAVLYHVPKSIRRNRIPYLLQFVELWERRNDLVKRFSGGMKRRLEIARGLLHHPKIIFLDEPTLGLDPQTRNHIWEYLLRLNQEEKITIFFSTHYMEEAERVAQRIIIIDHGTIIAEGSPAALKQQSHSETMEEAFIKFTGKNIRDEDISTADTMRIHRRLWKR